MVTKTGTMPQAWFLESLWLAFLFLVILSIRVSGRVFQSSEFRVNSFKSSESRVSRDQSYIQKSSKCSVLAAVSVSSVCVC